VKNRIRHRGENRLGSQRGRSGLGGPVPTPRRFLLIPIHSNGAVAGLAFSAARLFVSSPGQTDDELDVVCLKDSSDLFDAPERSRSIVVGLFPKDSRKANGNSCVEGLFSHRRNRFFNLERVHMALGACPSSRKFRNRGE
jgi:hypothetical protein